MRVSTAAVFAVLLSLPAGTRADERLAQPYRITLGEVVALNASVYLAVAQINGQTDETLMASYDKDARRLMVWVFGTENVADGARASLEKLWAVDILPMRTYLQGLFDVELGDADLAVIYLNRDSRREIIRRENGQYVVPAVDRR